MARRIQAPSREGLDAARLSQIGTVGDYTKADRSGNPWTKEARRDWNRGNPGDTKTKNVLERQFPAAGRNVVERFGMLMITFLGFCIAAALFAFVAHSYPTSRFLFFTWPTWRNIALIGAIILAVVNFSSVPRAIYSACTESIPRVILTAVVLAVLAFWFAKHSIVVALIVFAMLVAFICTYCITSKDYLRDKWCRFKMKHLE